jgi:AbrB family looped-hinge helix DNA binding protein
MTTTIDRAGRVVIPKSIREIAGFQAGEEIEIEYRDGRIEIEPRPAAMSLKKVGKGLVIVAPPGAPAMSAATVKATLRSVRGERERKRVAGRQRS